MTALQLVDYPVCRIIYNLLPPLSTSGLLSSNNFLSLFVTQTPALFLASRRDRQLAMTVNGCNNTARLFQPAEAPVFTTTDLNSSFPKTTVRYLVSCHVFLPSRLSRSTWRKDCSNICSELFLSTKQECIDLFFLALPWVSSDVGLRYGAVGDSFFFNEGILGKSSNCCRVPWQCHSPLIVRVT